ncbi:MAG: matrixin family metalloprotease [Nanoarchaeota archaeon]|nr:matrixin family metalloprotease [Nanoarchaeota archaeon]
MRWALIVLGFLLVVLGVAVYIFMIVISDFYAEPVHGGSGNYSSGVDFWDDSIVFSGNVSFPYGDFQFHPNMRFPRGVVTFKFYPGCNNVKATNMRNAMRNLTMLVPGLNFMEVYENEEIEISCDDEEIEIDEIYFVAGEGGPIDIINTSLFTIIKKGKILLLYESSCNNNVDMHELLHVFGFKHSNNKDSIMYSINSCEQVMTDDIVAKLSKLYSYPSDPDLYFFNVSATKKGRYLDFDIGIKNQGLGEARIVKLSVYSNDELVEIFPYGNLNYGAGRVVRVNNLRIPGDTTKVKFIINEDNLFEELSLSNNMVVLDF